jgi:hypothetical protein
MTMDNEHLHLNIAILLWNRVIGRRQYYKQDDLSHKRKIDNIFVVFYTNDNQCVVHEKLDVGLSRLNGEWVVSKKKFSDALSSHYSKWKAQTHTKDASTEDSNLSDWTRTKNLIS